jgi:hypothetical protein
MGNQGHSQLGMAVLLLLAFAVSSGVAVLAIYSAITASTPLVVSATLVALLSLYGFYDRMSEFIGSRSKERTVG